MTCAPSEDSDQPRHPPSLRCPHEETMGPQLHTERTTKTLIRLGEVILLVLLCTGSYGELCLLSDILSDGVIWLQTKASK